MEQICSNYFDFGQKIYTIYEKSENFNTNKFLIQIHSGNNRSNYVCTIYNYLFLRDYIFALNTADNIQRKNYK